MNDLRTSIATLKAALERTPRDSNTRPVHEALIDVVTRLAEEVERLESDVIIMAGTVPMGEFISANEFIAATTAHIELPPKRKGWPAGKKRGPRKPVTEAPIG